MAALTWYMTNNLAGTAHQEMSETDPGTEATASPQTGWVVSTGATNHASFDAQSNVAAASFTATTQPDGTPVTTAGAGDCLRTTNTYSGTFAAANWTFSFCFRGVTQAGTQDGRVRFRLLRGTAPDGSNAVDISGSQQQASLVTNLLTTPTQTSSLAVNPGAITVNNEYIFVQIAWERTGAGGMTTTDVAFRIGNASGAGTRVLSSNFTPTPPTTTPPDLANVVNRPRLRPLVALALLAASGMTVPIVVPPAEEVPFVSASTTNSRVGVRTLFYQANIAPPVFASIPPPPVTIDKWQQPLSKAVPYPKVPGGRQHFAFGFPYDAGANVTIDKWQQPLGVAVPYPKVPGTRPAWTFGYPYLGVEPPPPFLSADVVTGRATTKSLFYQSRTQVYPPAAEAVTVTLDWQQPFSSAVKRPPTETGLYTPFVPSLAPQVSADEWLTPFTRAVARPPVANALYSPFVPAEATSQNTVTPDAWMRQLDRAVPIPRPAQSQPVFGYPYLGVDNYRFQWDWKIEWQGPPRYWPLGKPFQPFVPKEATRENTVTPDYWMPSWQGPPRLLLRLQPGQPFIPTAEVVDNTRTEIDWLVAWQGPPRLLLRLQPGSPFVPRAAVLENTVEPSYWMRQLDQAVAYPPPRHTQPFFGYPYEGVDNSRDQWDWHIQWKGPPRLWPLGKPYSPFVPAEATRQNTVTPDKWMRQLDRAAPYRKPIRTQPGYPYQTPPEAGTATPTIYWFQPLSRSVRLTPPFTGRVSYGGLTWTPQDILPQIFQYVPAAPNYVTFRKLTQYQAWVIPPTLTLPVVLQYVPAPPTYVTFRRYTQYQSWVKVPGIVPPGPITSFVQSPDTTVTFSRTVQYPSWVKVPGIVPPSPLPISFVQSPDTSVTFRRTIQYQASPFIPSGELPGQSQFVSITLTVEFGRVLRVVCNAQTADQFVTESETSDAWIDQAETTEGLVEQAEVSDTWSDQNEAGDVWTEQEAEPGAGCCDNGLQEEAATTEGDFQDDTFQDDSFE